MKSNKKIVSLEEREAFGELIQRLGRFKQEFAEYFGYDPSFVSHLLAGKRKFDKEFGFKFLILIENHTAKSEGGVAVWLQRLGFEVSTV